MSRPASWWILVAAFFWLADDRWDLNWLELLGLAVVFGAAVTIADYAWREVAAGAREGWNRDKEEEDGRES